MSLCWTQLLFDLFDLKNASFEDIFNHHIFDFNLKYSNNSSSLQISQIRVFTILSGISHFSKSIIFFQVFLSTFKIQSPYFNKFSIKIANHSSFSVLFAHLIFHKIFLLFSSFTECDSIS